MRAKFVLSTTIAAGALAVTGVGTGIAASAPAKPHTITFDSKTVSSKSLNKRTFVNVDKDTANGKYLGNDVLRVAYNPKKGFGKANVAVAFVGGFVYGQLHVAQDGTISAGKVTGGTGKYDGATGTITGTAKSKNVESVTITYK